MPTGEACQESSGYGVRSALLPATTMQSDSDSLHVLSTQSSLSSSTTRVVTRGGRDLEGKGLFGAAVARPRMVVALAQGDISYRRRKAPLLASKGLEDPCTFTTTPMLH